MSRPGYEDYRVGWICAIKSEETAAKAMLDEVHDNPLLQPRNDSNVYIRGRIGNHNVVIACLPAGKLGTHSAAITATNMFRTFTELRFSLLVGVGGGVPKNGASGARLGDIVVSVPRPKHPAVVQHDYGKTEDDGFVRTHYLSAPPRILLNAINRVQTEHAHANYGYLRYMANVPESVRALATLPDGNRPEPAGNTTNATSTFNAGNPRIIYGTVASGNQLMVSAAARDAIANAIDALRFEMEAAGVMDDFKCLIIRGICDNSDSGKTKEWQGRAALAAAAYAKELLSVVEPEEPARGPAAVISTVSHPGSATSSADPGLSLQEFKAEMTDTSSVQSAKPPESFFVVSQHIIESTSVGLGRIVLNTRAPWAEYCPYTTSPQEKDIGISPEPLAQEILEETKGKPVHKKFLTMLSRLVAGEDILGVIVRNGSSAVVPWSSRRQSWESGEPGESGYMYKYAD